MQEHTADTLDDLIGQEVRGMIVESVLGSGGMGCVFLARQKPLNLVRALKVIRIDLSPNVSRPKRFQREALALSRLQHHNIVQVLDSGQLENGWLYLTMEFIDGPDLASYIEKHGPMPRTTGLSVLRQLASALAYAHAQKIVHRDLKPENVVLRHGDPEQLKVIDFGLVKILGEENLTALTAESQLIGSPLYMAPEQTSAQGVGEPADVYALAGLGYFIFSGRAVFSPVSGAHALQLVMAHCHQRPEPLTSRCPHLADLAGLDELLLACLSKEPDVRPTAQDLVLALDALLSESLALDSIDTEIPPDDDDMLGIAAQVWSVSDDAAPSALLEAIGNQLTAVLLDLARESTASSPASSAMTRDLDELAATQAAIDDLGMERALLDAEIADGSPDRSAQLKERQRVLDARLIALREQAQRYHLSLFRHVTSQPPEQASPTVRAFRTELTTLLERYRDAVAHHHEPR